AGRAAHRAGRRAHSGRAPPKTRRRARGCGGGSRAVPPRPLARAARPGQTSGDRLSRPRVSIDVGGSRPSRKGFELVLKLLFKIVLWSVILVAVVGVVAAVAVWRGLAGGPPPPSQPAVHPPPPGPRDDDPDA